MSQAFYLKYRPQTFADLDSTETREQLIKTFSSGKIPHAFLLTGTKGIGKTSAARIIAKAVNCEKVPKEDFEPCNKCGSCISITNGSNVDVLEIDAASYTSVDDIRDLRDKIRLAPAGAKYKVFIIDEVHRLSAQAFDALLKTLEEPPRHVIFVLCTTELEKLPKTIVSRCQRINFRKATLEEIVQRLQKNCASENIECDKAALEKIARFSEGSFRDATKILEQVSFEGKATLAAVEKVIGISGTIQAKDLLVLLRNQDINGALRWIGQTLEQGINLKYLTEGILEQLRLNLLSSYGVATDLTEALFTTGECLSLIEIFNKAYLDLKNAVITQLPLEMAVVEWSETGSRKVEDGSERLDKEAGGEKLEVVSRKKDNSLNQEVSLQDPASHFSLPTSNFTLEEVNARWPQILEAVRPLNHSVLAFLRACRPKNCENGYITLEVFYKFHKDQLETEKCRRIFEQAASGVLNASVKLKCDLGEGKPVKLPPVPLPPIEDRKSSRNKKTAEDDIIKVAEEIFSK